MSRFTGVLWTQTSIEYNVSVVQAFRAAELRVTEALSDPDRTASSTQATIIKNFHLTHHRCGRGRAG
jgi:hypothetical protein